MQLLHEALTSQLTSACPFARDDVAHSLIIALPELNILGNAFRRLRRQFTDNGDFGVITYACTVLFCVRNIRSVLDGVARLTFTEKLNNPSE